MFLMLFILLITKNKIKFKEADQHGNIVEKYWEKTILHLEDSDILQYMYE
jgi:hypothetical protein